MNRLGLEESRQFYCRNLNVVFVSLMEAEHIMQCRGRVFCLEDEPGVYRVWMPNGKTPGLAISRNFVTEMGYEHYFFSTCLFNHTIAPFIVSFLTKPKCKSV